MIRRTGINRAWKLIVIGGLVGLGALAGRAGAQSGSSYWCGSDADPQACTERGGEWPPGATPGPGPHPQPTPPPCPNPTEIIVSGPHYDEDRTRCFVIVQVIDLCTNTFQGDPFTRYVECPKPTASNPCVDSSGNPLFSRDLPPLRPVLVAGDWGRPAMRRAPDLVRGRGPQGT
jgi:hypothetical protein